MALPMWGLQVTQSLSEKEALMATSSKAGFQPETLSAPSGDRSSMARLLCLEVLAASIVHELKQSLSDITGNAGDCLQKLSGHSLNFQRAHDAAVRTMRDANRAAAVIERMRSLFAKTEANNESVDLNQAAGEALLLSAHKLQARGVVVRRELEPDLPRITGDSLQLQQVILNLVMNAADAMNETHDRTRELVVRTQRGEGHVRLSVRDAGPGFEPRAADRLFDAFYTTKADGIGAGLFISRWIVENHRGVISAALNDGPGATFSFSIPS